MNTGRNLPIILRYEEDGNVVAECPLLPNFRCKGATREMALQAMQRLIKHAFLEEPNSHPERGRKYEVVHLAVRTAKDSAVRAKGSHPRPKAEPTANSEAPMPSTVLHE